VSRWGTKRLSNASFEANLVNVVLPTQDINVALQMVADLLESDGVYMLALQDEASGIVFTRLSSQIYLEMADFEKMGNLVMKYLGL